jgi:hypothetical protein
MSLNPFRAHIRSLARKSAAKIKRHGNGPHALAKSKAAKARNAKERKLKSHEQPSPAGFRLA